MKRCRLKIFYLELWCSFCPTQPNVLCKLIRGHYGVHICEIILDLEKWFRRRCRLKILHIQSSGGPSVQRSGPICAVLIW